MIPPAEIESTAATFGAPETQIVRDHLISHVLAVLGESTDLVFFGGTALCRTWLPNLRLSEDIDLLVNDFRDADKRRQMVSRYLRLHFEDLVWTAAGSSHDVETWMLSTGSIEVKVQFALWRHGWREIVPCVQRPVQLRYSDLAPTVDFVVPTGVGFAAMKVIAWMDRAAPRDLYDLAALAEAGHLNAEAIAVTNRLSGFTPTAMSIGNVAMAKVEGAWINELGHQGATERNPSQCMDLVRSALTA